MSAPMLFDPGPVSIPPAEAGMSYGQRLTIQNRRLLEAGTHPATRRPLLIGTGETCATCVHHLVASQNRTYHKCDKHRLGASSSEASDIRVSWPACVLYEPEGTSE